MARDDIKTPRPADEITGSQTGTIGGGGREGHNPSPVRGIGVDDETVGSASEEEFEDEDLEDEAFDDQEGDSEEFTDED